MSASSPIVATLTKSMGGGSNCCVVGCQCSSRKCFGLSFLSLPRRGVSKEQDEWRTSLIHAIARSDKSFNPATAKICSRHFEEKYIRKNASGQCLGLVPGSMPTRWMPVKSIVTPKTTRPEPRKEENFSYIFPQTLREPPVVPVRICYTNLTDMKKDLNHLPPRWIIMKNSEDTLVLGLLSSRTEELYIKVTFSTTTGLQANVSVLQMPAPWLSRDLEMVRLHVFLKELGEKTVCSGVTEADLQSLASTKITVKNYFRHITYARENDKLCSSSCVRASSCLLLLKSDELTCRECVLRRKALQAQKSRQEVRCQEALKSNDPLCRIPYKKLKEEFKQVRKEKTRLEKYVSLFHKQEEVSASFNRRKQIDSSD